jgi:hypothetical protein
MGGNQDKEQGGGEGGGVGGQIETIGWPKVGNDETRPF